MYNSAVEVNRQVSCGAGRGSNARHCDRTAASRLPSLARRGGAGNRSAPPRQRSLARVSRARRPPVTAYISYRHPI